MKRLPINVAARRLGLTVKQTIHEVYFGSLVARRGPANGLNRTLYFTSADLKTWKRAKRS